ncbi:MAG TPA: adenylate cyclase [Thermoanaerobaculia bacterium]|nr:adenylate cyclase [Thermoanaerobaculia bacterium]
MGDIEPRGATKNAAVGTAVARRAKPARTKTGREIERKWVLAAPPPLDDRQPEEIRQGYVLTGDAEMRVRKAGERCFLTIKRGAGEVRDEWESKIPAWAFDAVWPSTKGCRLRKQRYSIREKRRTIEVDVYEGKLAGLIVLETEFVSVRSAKRFTLPDWAAGAHEVTGDPEFSNQSLARKGLKKVRRRLS